MRSRGFTLVEVLVAFTIMAIVMGATLTAIGNGIAQEHRASETARQVLAARSLLEAVGVETPLRDGDLEGTLETGETWRLSLEAVAPAGVGDEDVEEPRLYLVEVTILDDGDRPSVRLVTLKRVSG